MTKPGTAAGATEVETRRRELLNRLKKEYTDATGTNATEYLECSLQLDSAEDVNEAMVRLAWITRELGKSIAFRGQCLIKHVLRQSMELGSHEVVRYLVGELLEGEGGSGRRAGRVKRWECENEAASPCRNIGDVLAFAVQYATRRSTMGVVVEVLRELGKDVTTPLDICSLGWSYECGGAVELAIRGLLCGNIRDYCTGLEFPAASAMSYALIRGGAWEGALKGKVEEVEGGMGGAKMKLFEDAAAYGVTKVSQNGSASVRRMHLVAIAAMSGSAATVEYVLERSVGEDEATAGMLSVALEVAAKSGSGGGVVEALFRGGARFGGAAAAKRAIRDAFQHDESGSTGIALLEVAAASGYSEAANPATYLPFVVYECGSHAGHVVHVLLEAGADVEAYVEHETLCMPSLLHAVMSDNVRGVYELLHAGAAVVIEQAGYDIGRNEIALGMPYEFDTRCGAIGATHRLSTLHRVRSGIVARVLVEAGAPVEEAYGGVTPLHVACIYGHDRVARVLVESGANVEAVLRGGKDEHSELNKPLLIAVGGLVGRSRWSWSEHAATIRALVAGGADVNGRGGSDGRGVTALLAVASPRRVSDIDCRFSEIESRVQDEVVEVLVGGGADIHAKDAGGNGVLHRAMIAQSADPGPLVEALLRHGARASDVNARGQRADEVWWVNRGEYCYSLPNGQWYARDVSEYILKSDRRGVDVTKPSSERIVHVCEMLRAAGRRGDDGRDDGRDDEGRDVSLMGGAKMAVKKRTRSGN